MRRKIDARIECAMPSAAAATLALMIVSQPVLSHVGLHDDHTQHQSASASRAAVTRITETYTLPAVPLVRSDGVAVRFPAEIDDGKPVILNFVYTTCPSVCPLMSQIFAEVQAKLGKEASRVRMVSISIDPEEDTPARLAEHARKFGAREQWQHYTGSAEASVSIQRAFKAYRGDKMGHAPATFLRAAPGQPWVRLEGFAGADVVIREYADLVGRGQSHSNR